MLARYALAVAAPRGVASVVALTRVDNAASRRVIEKVDLRYEQEFSTPACRTSSTGADPTRRDRRPDRPTGAAAGRPIVLRVGYAPLAGPASPQSTVVVCRRHRARPGEVLDR
jgi:hypothetical protein